MKCICTTTIYPPSKATLAFAHIAREDGWELIIAGDKKTPHEAYHALARENKSVTYLTPEMQDKLAPELSATIGWNSIQRRNLAFVWAWDAQAEICASVDDDNIPHANWGRDLMIGRTVPVKFHETNDCAFDPLSPFCEHCWHRGYPIQMTGSRLRNLTHPKISDFAADVQADLWNGDPDIDAIYRIVNGVLPVYLDPQYCPFASNKPAPFNSQNTFLLRKVLPHYFMHIGVGRSDDIWAAFHAQAQGFKVVFGKPSVTQERNPQDVMKNFEDEMLNYRYNQTICRAIPDDPHCVVNMLPARSREAFELYQARLK
jgi:hypothetical protein